MKRRLCLIAAVAALAGGLTSAHVASADPVDGLDGVDVRAERERYWACVAIDHVEIGACLSNPLPDLSRYPSVPEIVNGVLGSLEG